MQYHVREIVDKKMLADRDGIICFDTVESAKDGGIGAGTSFMVVENAYPFRTILTGLSTGMGFFFLDGTLQNRDTSSGLGVVGSIPAEADQKHIRPLV